MTQVPSVDCGIVLKKVPELLCVPEVYEDCNDVAIQVPYIDTGPSLLSPVKNSENST